MLVEYALRQKGLGLRNLEERTLLLLVITVSLVFAWILGPFFGAVLWGVAVAIVFAPFNRRLLAAMPRRRNLAAFVTLLIIMAMVILPAILISIFLLQEAYALYDKVQSGEMDFGRYIQQMQAGLPAWAVEWMNRLGLSNLDVLQEKLSSGLGNSLRVIATQALDIGQSAFGFIIGLGVMLYLTFFLLRDGDALSHRIIDAIPLAPEQRRTLVEKFIIVIRAIIKGSIVVAVLQGAIGGLVFWGLGIHAPLLWGVLMGFMSLLPAVGTGIIWVPVAIYLLLTGAIWQGLVLVGCGLFVIGMVDNLLRPILVGKDARIPDYIVLITTLGGIELFGFAGIVIGPAVAAMFIVTWEIFTKARHQNRGLQNGA